jgi:hypothetical protein
MNAPHTPKLSLASAFVQAQKSFAPALKSSLNPHFKSKYVDLAGCVEAVIDALNNNGIALMQHTAESESGVIVETVFLHESGETLSCGKLHVPASKQDAQGYGSALTYARRYSLMAACGIAPEDDDGNAASKGKQATKAPVKAALEGVSIAPERQEELKSLAADLVHYVESCDDPITAANVLTEAELDGDHKLFLWDVLQPNSKTRSAIKKEMEGRKSLAGVM